MSKSKVSVTRGMIRVSVDNMTTEVPAQLFNWNGEALCYTHNGEPVGSTPIREAIDIAIEAQRTVSKPEQRARRTADQIRNHPFVASLHQEDDGYREDGRPAWWCYLHAGFICPSMECGTIHEGTLAEVNELLNECRRATREEIENQGYSFEEAVANWYRYDS